MVTREGEGSTLSDREKAIDTAIKEIEAQLEIRRRRPRLGQ